jgi:WD40 repeat protein
MDEPSSSSGTLRQSVKRKFDFTDVTDICTVCLQNFTIGRFGEKQRTPYVGKCGHMICSVCTQTLLKRNRKAMCPYCKSSEIQEFQENVTYCDITRKLEELEAMHNSKIADTNEEICTLKKSMENPFKLEGYIFDGYTNYYKRLDTIDVREYGQADSKSFKSISAIDIGKQRLNDHYRIAIGIADSKYKQYGVVIYEPLVENKVLYQQQEVHTKPISGLYFHPISYHLLMSTSLDGTVALIDTRENTKTMSVSITHEPYVTGTWNTTNGNEFAAGNLFGSVHIFDIRSKYKPFATSGSIIKLRHSISTSSEFEGRSLEIVKLFAYQTIEQQNLYAGYNAPDYVVVRKAGLELLWNTAANGRAKKKILFRNEGDMEINTACYDPISKSVVTVSYNRLITGASCIANNKMKALYQVLQISAYEQSKNDATVFEDYYATNLDSFVSDKISLSRYDAGVAAKNYTHSRPIKFDTVSFISDACHKKKPVLFLMAVDASNNSSFFKSYNGKLFSEQMLHNWDAEICRIKKNQQNTRLCGCKSIISEDENEIFFLQHDEQKCYFYRMIREEFV